jgi:hypothetical protein
VVVASTVVLTAVVDTLVALVDVVLSESSLHAANRPPTASTVNTARNGEVMKTVSRIESRSARVEGPFGPIRVQSRPR